MNSRHFAKVVKKIDEYTVVINKGAVDGVSENQSFLIIELGESIRDPDTDEVIEQLEIVKGKVRVSHVQEKISTLKSCDYDTSEGSTEIKKTINKGGLSILGLAETITESTIPGAKHLKNINQVNIGDLVLKI